MKVLYSWLKDYVDIDIEPKELETKLFSAGFEVEGIEYLGKNLENVVVGQITAMEHYEGTHLQICHVDCGDKGHDHLILTGANNVFVGAKVPAALVGAKLPCGLEIQPRKMVDMMSYGMLCSGEELELNKDWYPGADVNGIMILAEDAPLGMEMRDYLELDDYLFDISITANRPDCQSIFGMAREVAAVLEKELKMPDISYTETGVTLEGFNVSVDCPELCPRYSAHYVHDVKIGESPAWMKRRLALVGIGSISNVVDITNYVLKELGQPMHAFDCTTLEGNAIRVRRATEGEKIVTLDEDELTLTTENMVICDGVKPVALAGVMGGLNSEIRETTNTVLFESAKFARDNVRRTSRAVGKTSDSSSRYAKGVDEYATVMGLKRALHLMEELGCGKVSSTHVDVNTGNSVEPKALTVSISKVNKCLGIVVPNEEILRIMTNLSFAPVIDGDNLTLQVPAYREDVETYQDIAEEVIRMYGYDHIVPTFMPTAQVTVGGENTQQKTEMRLKKALCSVGAHECIHYSFFSPSDLDMLKLPEDAMERHAIRIMNPISEELSLMRTTLAASMINAVVRNQKKGNLEGRLFEIAKKFIPKELPLTEYPDERETLCVTVFGEKESFFTMKGIAEKVADTLHLNFTYANTTNTFMHPYQTASISCEGVEVGYFGKIAYDVADECDLRTPMYLMEIDLKALSQWYGKKAVFKPLPKFAEEQRDLAIVVNKNITCGEIEETMKEACKYITSIKLFDIYEGAQIGEDKKSMAFTVLFTPKDEAFGAESVDGFVKKILKQLGKKFEAELRS